MNIEWSFAIIYRFFNLSAIRHPNTYLSKLPFWMSGNVCITIKDNQKNIIVSYLMKLTVIDTSFIEKKENLLMSWINLSFPYNKCLSIQSSCHIQLTHAFFAWNCIFQELTLVGWLINQGKLEHTTMQCRCKWDVATEL